MSWTLITELSLDEINRHWLELERAGMLGAAEIDGHASLYFERPVRDLTIPGRWEPVPDRDWTALWRTHLTPVRVGAVLVTPPWLATGSADEIVIDPGQAFGTGHHETTVACLHALQRLDLHGRRVLDLGTGSGILAIAAARAGARVLALDTDPIAVEVAKANLRRNGTEAEVRTGSLAAAGADAFDVIVANLDTETLTRLAPALAQHLRTGGWLIASGTSNDRGGEVASALTAAGLQAEVEPGREWSLLVASAVNPSPRESR